MMEHIANGLIVLDAGLGAYKVYEDWKEGKDWEYELIQDVVDIVAAFAIGAVTAAAFAFFIGGGWVVCLVAGVVAGAGSLVVDHYSDYYGHKFAKPLIDRLRASW